MSLNKGTLDKAIQELELILIRVQNQGSGADPVISSSSSSKGLSIADRILVEEKIYFKGTGSFYNVLDGNVSATRTTTLPDRDLDLNAPVFPSVEIINAGVGGNPIIDADSGANKLRINGAVQIGDTIQWLDGLSVGGSLAHANTASRVYTFPDKAFTVADHADITELQAQNLIGSANKKFMNCVYHGEADVDFFEVELSTCRYINSHTGTIHIFFMLDLACNKGSKKLYVDSLRQRIMDADGNNKVVNHYIYGIALDGTPTEIDEDLTETTSAGLRQGDFTAHDCSGYEQILVEIQFGTAQAGAIDFYPPQIRSYFDT